MLGLKDKAKRLKIRKTFEKTLTISPEKRWRDYGGSAAFFQVDRAEGGRSSRANS